MSLNDFRTIVQERVAALQRLLLETYQQPTPGGDRSSSTPDSSREMAYQTDRPAPISNPVPVPG